MELKVNNTQRDWLNLSKDGDASRLYFSPFRGGQYACPTYYPPLKETKS